MPNFTLIMHHVIPKGKNPKFDCFQIQHSAVAPSRGPGTYMTCACAQLPKSSDIKIISKFSDDSISINLTVQGAIL